MASEELDREGQTSIEGYSIPPPSRPCHARRGCLRIPYATVSPDEPGGVRGETDDGAGGTGGGAKGRDEESIIFLRNESDNFSPDKNYLLPSQSNHHWVPLLLPDSPFSPPFVDCCVLNLLL